MVVPDNALFEKGAGELIRNEAIIGIFRNPITRALADHWGQKYVVASHRPSGYHCNTFDSYVSQSGSERFGFRL